MSLNNIISLLFGSGILTGILGAFYKKLKASEDKTTAVCLGVQALLRDRLLQTYDKYTAEGYAPTYARENFENMWQQYHSLGANGVMNDYHKKFMDLPNKKEEVENHESKN